MPISEAQRIECRDLACLQDIDSYFELALDKLSDAQITRVESILEQFRAIQFKNSALKGEFNQSDGSTRKRLRASLFSAICYSPFSGNTYQVNRA